MLKKDILDLIKEINSESPDYKINSRFTVVHNKEKNYYDLTLSVITISDPNYTIEDIDHIKDTINHYLGDKYPNIHIGVLNLIDLNSGFLDNSYRAKTYIVDYKTNEVSIVNSDIPENMIDREIVDQLK